MDRCFIIRSMIMIIIRCHKGDVMDGKCINHVCPCKRGTLIFLGGKMLGGCRFFLYLNVLMIVLLMRKCVHCGGLVNCRYHRGPASDYDRWAKLTNDPSWSYKSLLPLFRKSEGFEDTTFESDYIIHNLSEKYHGRDGEWKVSYQAYFHKCSSYFIRATEYIGMKFNPDFNAETTLGVGRIQTFVDAKDTARSNT